MTDNESQRRSLSKGFSNSNSQLSNDGSQDGDKNINLLILATTFPRWEKDTHPKFVKDLSKELKENGINVSVLAPHDAGAKRHEEMSGISVYRFPYFVPYRFQKLAYGGGILPTIKSNPLTLLLIPFFIMSLAIHTAWILTKEDIQLINSHWVVPNGVVASCFSKVFKVHHVSTLHAGGVLGLQNIPGREHISAFVYQNSDGFIPVSSHIRDSFFEIVPQKVYTDDNIQIQPMGAHTSDFNIDTKSSVRSDHNVSNKTIGLYVGRLTEKKGVDHLLNSVSELADHSDNFKMIIVGKGERREELTKLANRNGINKFVEFTGWVSETKLHNYYVMADFVVVPSIETKSGDTEGMPTVISEAFAAGNPVIGTDVGGIPDVVEHGVNGYIVPQKDSSTLANKMQQMIEDVDHREQLAEEAEATAKELDWERCGKTYTELFYEVCELKDNVAGSEP